MKQTDSPSTDVIFTVVNGYHLKDRLKPMGFRFDGLSKKWICRIPATQVNRVQAVEELLKQAEGGKTGPPWPPTTVRG